MSRLLDALSCKNEGRPPLWMMRQAGRYLPEYRAIRKQHTIETMFKTPELAKTITLQPIERYGFDAAILFADILTVCHGFGLDVTFEGGPKVTGTPKPFNLSHVNHIHETITLLKQELNVPLIGFCGGPYTVNRYLEKPIDQDALIDATIRYLKLQIQAGVDAVQIFDSWAGHLPKSQFCKDILPGLKTIVDAIRPFPTIVFTRGSCHLIDELVSLEPTAISFDWDLPMHELRARVPKHIAVQGNLDPAVLKLSPNEITHHVKTLIEPMYDEPGFIFNLGHGLSPDIPPEGVAQCKAALHEIYLKECESVKCRSS